VLGEGHELGLHGNCHVDMRGGLVAEQYEALPQVVVMSRCCWAYMSVVPPTLWQAGARDRHSLSFGLCATADVRSSEA
jgi:hypothetical protein